MLIKNLAAPLGSIVLALSISAPALALNPQPLPPGKILVTSLALPGHGISPPICKGPPKTPNICK